MKNPTIAKKKVHRMESVAKPILFTAASKLLRKVLESGINVTHGAHRLGIDAAGKLTKTKIPWSERSQRAVPGKENLHGDTIQHGRGSPFSTFAHEAGHADDFYGSAAGAERVARYTDLYAAHHAQSKWYKPRQAPSDEFSRNVRGNERRANASAERMLREGGATDEYIQRFRNERAEPLNSYKNAYKVSAPRSASAVPPPAAAPSNPVIPTASPSNPLAAPAPSANPGVPAQPVPLAPPPPSANPGAPIKPSLGGLGVAAAGVGAVGIGAGANAASGDKPRRKQPFGFSSPSPLIQFMQKWEKVVKSLPPDRAEGIIRTIARTVRPLKGGFVGDYTPSQRLLTRALYPKKIENLPEAIVRTKESLRDARIAGDNWNISPNKKRKNRALMKRGAKPSFAEARGLDPEEEVGIIHGGGEAHIRDFIAGKSRGYKLEGDRRTGIQVHPINAMGGAQLRDRTRFYANRAAGMAYDNPAMLTGTVKRKHLVTANNSYEGAVVDPTHISRPKVRPLRRTEDRPSGEYWAEETASKIGTTEPIRKYVIKREQRLSSLSPLIQLASAAWQRKEGKSASGGLNRKGVASYRRENPGSKLKTAVTTPPSKLDPNSKAAKRRKSFCARMSGMQGPMKKPNGEPTRKALSLRKWNCSSKTPLIQLGIDKPILLGTTMSNLRSLSARLDSILFATGISKKYLPGTVWDRDVEVKDEATGKKRKKPSLAKEYYKAVIKQTEPRKTSIKKNRGQPDWVGERGVDRKQNPDLFRTVTDSPVHHQTSTHQWTSDSTGAKIGKPFQYTRRTIDDPTAPGGLRLIAPKDLLNTEGYRALRIKQMAKADEPKVRRGYSDAELDARNVPESKRELLRQGTDATRDPRTQGEIRVASRAIRKGLVSGDVGPEISKMRTAIARDADINRRITHRIRKEKGDPGFLRGDPKIHAISGGSNIPKEDSSLLAAARKNFDTHLAGETERRKLQAGQIAEMVRRRAHERLVEQEHGPNWSTKLEGRSRAEAFAKYEKRAQDYASSITSSVPQRHDELAALIGAKPEGLEKVRENYNNLKESDYKTERKVQNRIINSGRIFDGSPAFSPEAPKPAVKAGYPNLKRLGIAGALVGGGLLARQLIKKRREKQEQEAQPQLMSSRIRAIRFGNKFPIPKAVEQKLSDLAQRLLRNKSGETDAREHLMSKVKVGRPAGPEQPAGQWDQVEAAQDLNPETIDIVTTAKKRLRKALQKPGGLKALKVEELIGEKTAAGMSPMDKGLFKGKKKKLESISTPMPTRGKRAAMAQGRTLPDAVERGDIEGVKTLFARQGPSKPPISVFKPGTVEREMVNPAPKMIPLTTEQAQLRMAIERVKRASVVRNLRNDKRGYIKRTGQDPDVAVNNARSAELIAKSNQRAAEESARTEILAARENAKAEIKKASQQAADYQEAALGKQAAINRTESEKARSRAFRNAAIGTGLGFTGGALIAGNASRQSYEPKKQLQQPIRKLLMSARSKPIAFDYGQPRRDYAKIGTDAALGAGLSVAGTGALLYGAGKVLNKRMPDLAHMLNTASKQHINVFRPSKVIPMVKAIPQASGLFGKQMKIVREGEEMIASGKFPDPEALKKRMSSAGVSTATAEEMKRFTKKHGRSPSDVMERSVGMLSGASSTIIGGLGGAALSPGWEKKKNHKMSAISRMIRFDRGERSETRKKSTLRHDIATGALEGLAVGPFMEPAFSYLQGEKVEPIMRSGFRGLARRALIGGAMGATTSAAIGMLVNAADKERRKELKRTGRPILFATPQAASPRGAIARDKYDNAVFDQDEVRAEKNYKRAALAGGGLAVLLRGPRTRLGTFLAGSGAGLGAQLVTRYITESSKDQFGDRSHLAKRIDRLPWQIPAAIAAGIIGKRAYKAGALKMSRKGKLIEFYSQEDMERAIKSQKEDDRNWSRAKSQVSRATQGIKRGTRLTQDLIRSAKGQKNLDSRGRERKREWDKPWVRNALTGVIAVGTVAGFNKIIKGTGPSSALGRAKEMWHRGTFRNYAREKIPGFKKVNDWVRGFKKNATAEAGEAVENSGLLHRMLNRVQKGSGEVGKQPVQVAGKGGAVTTLNPGTTAYDQHMKKITPESEKAAAKEVADAESAEAKKLKNIQAGGLYELSSRLDSILFAEEDWEDRRDGDLVLTKIRRRKRDLKPTLKRKDWQDAVVIPAMLGGSLLTGALGARLLGPRIAAAGAEVGKSARRNVQTKDLRDEMKQAVGMQSRSPLVALNARLARLEFGTRTLASGHVVTWGKDLTLGKAYKKVARDNRGAYRITDPETKAEITVHRSRGKEMPEGKFVRGAQSEKWWKGKNAMISLMKVPKGNRKGDGLSNRGGRAMVEILGGTRKSGDQLVHTGLLGHFDKRGITVRSVASDYQKRGLNAIAEGTADRVGMYQRKGFKIDSSRVPDELGMSVIRRPGAKRNEPISKEKFYKIPSKYRQKEIKTATGALVDHFENIPGKRLVATSAAIGGASLLSGNKREKSTAEKVIDAATIGAGVPATYMAGKYIYDNAENIGSNIKIAAKNAAQEAVIRPALRGTGNTKKIADVVFRKGATLLARR